MHFVSLMYDFIISILRPGVYGKPLQLTINENSHETKYVNKPIIINICLHRAATGLIPEIRC